jgi:ABC-type oligopeptide transport system substrate-binding subunit
MKGLPDENGIEVALKKFLQSSFGCEISVEGFEMGEYAKIRWKNEHDLFFHGVGPSSVDPITVLSEFIRTENETDLGFQSAEIKAFALDLNRKGFKDRSDNGLKTLQQMIYEEGYVIPLGTPVFKYVLSQRVRQVELNPFGMHLNRWTEIRLDD